MTAPDTAPCGTCGVVHLGQCPGPMTLCLSPGYLFEGTVELRDATGTPIDWPEDTAARMRFLWGDDPVIYPATIDGPYLRIALTGAQTLPVPRGAIVYLDVNYDAGDPDRWRPWRRGRVGPCS